MSEYRDKQKTSPATKEKINQLIQEIQPSTILGSDNAKTALRNFARFLFEENKNNQPYIGEEDCFFLLQGDIFNTIGLLQRCGSIKRQVSIGTSEKQLKWSSVMCLELIDRLLNPDLNSNAYSFQMVLSKIDVRVIPLMKLHLHILSDRGKTEIAFRIIAYLKAKISALGLSFIVQHPKARDIYIKWELENTTPVIDLTLLDEKEEEEIVSDPKCWADVDHQLLFQMEEYEDLSKMTTNTNNNKQLNQSNILDLFTNSKPSRVAGHNNSNPPHLPNHLSSRRLSITVNDPLDIFSFDTRGHRQMMMRKRTFIKKYQSHSSYDHIADKDTISVESSLFNPLIYLSEIHGDTQLLTLEKGLKNIKNSLSNRAHQLQLLVSENFSHFIQCHQTLQSINNIFQSEFNEDESLSSRIQKLFYDSQFSTHHLVAPLLKRKKESDNIYYQLKLLKKYEVFLSIPRNIENNLKLGKYDNLVKDYKYFKSLSIPNIPFLQRVSQHINQSINEFRHYLWRQLEQPSLSSSSYSSSEYFISLLLNLDCHLDRKESPHSFCIKHHSNFLLHNMNTIYNNYHHEISQSSTNNHEFCLKKILTRMTNLIKNNIPNLFNVVQIYLQNQFKLNKYIVDISADSLKKPLVNEDSASIPSITTYIDQIFHKYAENVRSLIFSSSVSKKNISSNLSYTVSIILSLYHNLKSSSIVPQSLECLQTLVEDISRFYIYRTLSYTFYQISMLYKEEQWITHREITSLTLLPSRLQQILQKVCHNIITLPFSNHRFLLSISSLGLLECFKAYADATYYLLFHGEEIDCHLLQLRSNLLYVMTEIIPDIWGQYLKVIFTDHLKKDFQNLLQQKYEETLDIYRYLIDIITRKYIKIKMMLCRNIIQNGLFQNISTTHVIEIRHYVFDLLLSLVVIFYDIHDIYSPSPFSLSIILQQLSNDISSSFLIFMEHLNLNSSVIASQILLEIEFIKSILRPYQTPLSIKNYNHLSRLCHIVMDPSTYNIDHQHSIIQKTLTISKVLFSCFSFQNTNSFN